MQTTDVFWGCAAGIVLAIVTYNIVGRVRKAYTFYRQRAKSKKIVQDFLHASIPQRSTFRLEVLQGEFKGLYAEGVCSAVDAKSFRLQVTNAFGVHQWTDAPISMFFPITQDEVQTFYHFSAVAHSADRNENYTELTFAVPPSISPGQNRAFLRFTPPKPLVLAFGLWLMQGARPLPLHKEELAKPFLLYKLHANNTMELDNISAGGMRVFIHESGMNYKGELFKPGAHVLFLLVLVGKNLGKNKKELKKVPVPPRTAAQAAPHLAHNGEVGAGALVEGEQGLSAQLGSQGMTQDQVGHQATGHISVMAQLKDATPSLSAAEGTLQAEQGEEAGQSGKSEKKPTQSFWLSCRVRALTHDEQENMWQVSLRFDAWSLHEEGAEKISWFPTDSDQSVPPLAAWIMRSHMEQTKKI